MVQLKRIREIKVNSNSGGKELMVSSLSVSRNGMHLAAGGSGVNVVQVFNFDTGRFIGQSDSYRSPVTHVSMSPFGASFIAGAENGLLNCYMIRLRQIP